MFDIRHRNRYLIEPLSLIPCSVYTFPFNHHVRFFDFIQARFDSFRPLDCYTFLILSNYSIIHGSMVLRFYSLQNLPLHYYSSCSDFGFEFVEIFLFEKRLPAINDAGSRRLRVSVIRGVPYLK